MKKFDYYMPESLKEAYELFEKFKGRARYIAGGTDLLPRIKAEARCEQPQLAFLPDALISLRRIKPLKGITQNGGLSLGSMTTFREIEKDAAIARDYPALAEAISVLAHPQIRNVATVGGNICNASPCADSVPPLMVMDAILVLEGPGGKREVPLSDFFVGPGLIRIEPSEILIQIKVPELALNTRMKFLEIGRLAQDIAVVNAAVLLVIDNKICRKCRLAVGSVAPVPLRLKNAENMIDGNELTPDLLDQVAKKVEQEVNPINDVRATEEYRRTVAGVLIKRAIQRAVFLK
jgi:carbon-monoxide dehydrogenase medium subunit